MVWTNFTANNLLVLLTEWQSSLCDKSNSAQNHGNLQIYFQNLLLFEVNVCNIAHIITTLSYLKILWSTMPLVAGKYSRFWVTALMSYVVSSLKHSPTSLLIVADLRDLRVFTIFWGSWLLYIESYDRVGFDIQKLGIFVPLNLPPLWWFQKWLRSQSYVICFVRREFKNVWLCITTYVWAV